MTPSISHGALVISLDFELHWGVRDHTPLDAAERKRLLTARAVVPDILLVFRDHGVRATWAAVGMLFAHSRDEAEYYRPELLPKYKQIELNPYLEVPGRDESEDPFHFAPSLIREVAQQPGQELASHSYSHYYSLEEGQTVAEFACDLASAKNIASNSGYNLCSYVFPRNQVRPRFLAVLGQAGFTSYRGTEAVAAKGPVPFRQQRRPLDRAVRLLDAYLDLNGPQLTEWPQGGIPVPVNASRYLRPYTHALRAFENARFRRIADAMTRAAQEKQIFHLWWHPEDFAGDPERNLHFLNGLLTTFDLLRREYNMASLSMGDVHNAIRPSTNKTYSATVGSTR